MKRGLLLIALVLLSVFVVAERVIVTTHAPLDVPGLQVAGIRAAADRFGDIEHEIPRWNVMIMDVNPAGFAALQNHPGVKSISKEVPIHAALAETIPIINADEVHAIQVNGQNLTGSGQTLCVIDTGINRNHTDFQNRIINEQCFCAGGGGCCPLGGSTQSGEFAASDDNGHGTHVAGITAASNGTTGVAPNASLVIVKILDSAGNGGSGDLLLAMNHCLDHNTTAQGMSLATATTYSTQSACDALVPSLIPVFADMVTNGSWPVVASGNSGSQSGLGWPACLVNATAIGSTTDGDAISSFTNRNFMLDLLAPGSSVLSTSMGGGYTTQSGTSQATPHVVGAAALLQQAHLAKNGFLLTPPELETILNDTGVIVGQWTRIDIKAAYDSLLDIEATAVNNSDGRVSFGFNISEQSVQKNVKIGPRFVSVDSKTAPALNTTANVTIENVACPFTEDIIMAPGHYTSFGEVQANGVICPDTVCSNIQCAANTLTFTVSHFSGFATGSNANLTINDSLEGGSSITGVEQQFYAFYVNSTSGAHIPSATCNATFDDGAELTMFENGSFYQINKTYLVGSTRTWEVTCDHPSFTQLTAQDTIYIIDPSVPEFSTIIMWLLVVGLLGGVFVLRKPRN